MEEVLIVKENDSLNAKQTNRIILKEGEIHTSRVDLNTLCDMVLMMAAGLVHTQ